MYRNKLIVYIDILGFSKIVTENTFYSANKVIDDFIKTMTQNDTKSSDGGLLNDYHEKIGFNCYIISDSVIFTFNIDSEKYSNYELLYYVTSNLIGAQIEFLELNKLFLRGAICTGDIFEDFSHYKIFGPGLIEAIKTEQKINLPYIAISANLIQDIKAMRNNKFWSEITHYNISSVMKNFSYCDLNKLYFLNYLNPELNLTKSLPNSRVHSIYKSHLDSIRNLEQNCLYLNDKRLIEKKDWLIKYHNKYVRDKFEDLLI